MAVIQVLNALSNGHLGSLIEAPMTAPGPKMDAFRRPPSVAITTNSALAAPFAQFVAKKTAGFESPP